MIEHEKFFRFYHTHKDNSPAHHHQEAESISSDQPSVSKNEFRTGSDQGQRSQKKKIAPLALKSEVKRRCGRCLWQEKKKKKTINNRNKR